MWRCRLALALALATAISGAESPLGHAAMRYCMTTIVGEGAAASEIDAKRRAMDDWKTKSIAAGIEHPAWRIAHEKSLKCENADTGGFVCSAIAGPCTISQVPPAPESP